MQILVIPSHSCAYLNKKHSRNACRRTPAPRAHPSARRTTSARENIQ